MSESHLTERRDERGRWLELPPAMKARQWKPGHVANPGGKTGAYGEMQRLAREFSPEATAMMIEIVRDPAEDPKIRAFLWDKLLDRAWGKAKEYDPKAEEQPGVAFDPSVYSPQELADLRRLMLKAVSLPVDVSADHGNNTESASDNKEVGGK